MNKKINIVSFDVPFPPNYGGIIDVFYKIKALKELGIKIYLHTFEYGSGEQNELLNFCEKVYYYKRNLGMKNLFSKLPYIVKTRDNQKLINNLLTNDFPILFEGLHSTSPLLKINFSNRKTIVRAHNIEHKYYYGLAKSETNLFKKLFFISEAIKLKYYETILNKVNFILPISPLEQEYFSLLFSTKSIYTPAFQGNTKVDSKQGKGNYAVYNGDLRVVDNIKACYFLIKIFSNIEYPLIITSNFENKKIRSKIKKYNNITFRKISDKPEMLILLSNAHINILPTFQNTGIKLKLINALFISRFCLANNAMVNNTGLENLCLIANTTKEFTHKINQLINENFTQKEIIEREKVLTVFNSKVNALKITELI